MRTLRTVSTALLVFSLAACGGKSKGGTSPGNSRGKGAPAPAGPVTVEMLQTMAKAPGGLAAFLDPAAGIIDVHVVSTPGGGEDPDQGGVDQEWAKPLCGAEAQALVDEAGKVIVERIGDQDRESSCNTIEAPPAEPADPLEQAIAKDEVGGEVCQFGGAAEYDLSYELYFRRDGADGKGRRLSRIQVVDVGSEITGDILSTLNVLVATPQTCK